MKPRIAESGPSRLLGLAAAAFLLSAGVARSASYDIKADKVNVTMPTGEVVPMWGFGLLADPSVSVPGPGLVVPSGETTLTINLTNNLPEPVSIVIPGQIATMAPVFFTDATGRRRVRSFAAEANPSGGTQSYTWTGLKPGTYLYQSGSHPGVQVQMGLYGSLRVQPASGQVYPGVAYDKDVVVVLSEVDPALHAAVDASDYGPGKSVTSPVDYHPKYFLVNGAPYVSPTTGSPAGTPISTDAGGATLNTNDTILVRFLNAGLKTHMLTLYPPTPASPPGIPAQYFTIPAEDGNPYPYPRQLYTVYLPAGKTTEGLFSPPASGLYTLLDKTLHLTNGNSVGDAGLQAALLIADAGAAPVAAADTYSMDGNTTLTVPALTGVLANDTGSGTLTANLVGSTTHGSLTLAADGSFVYVPTTGFAGTDTFSYKANNGANSNTATATITVNLPPVGTNDSYSVIAGTTLNVPAPGVLGNDTSPAGKPLTAVLGTAPSAGTLTLNGNGNFTYVAPATAGPYSFTYTASDGTLSSGTVAVSLTVNPPQPPVATANAYTTTATATSPSLAVVAPGVLGNDTSPANLPLSAVLVTGPTKLAGGLFTLNGDGSFTYWTKNLTATADTFTYRASDGALQSGPATVTITITAHPAPVARDDTFPSTAFPTLIPRNSPGVTLNVLANDTATNAAIDPATVTKKSNPSRGGTITINANGTITYKPARNFRGTDVFTYNVKDTLGSTSNTATVRVNVR